MGVDTDAILFWGFHMPGDWDKDGAVGLAEGDLDGRYAGEYSRLYVERALGIGPPAVPYSDEAKDEYCVYWDKLREAEKSLGSYGIDVGIHCSYDCPRYYFAVAASVTCAHRGDPEEIANHDVGDDWHAKLEAYCKVMGLEMQEPKWWLVSLWG